MRHFTAACLSVSLLVIGVPASARGGGGHGGGGHGGGGHGGGGHGGGGHGAPPNLSVYLRHTSAPTPKHATLGWRFGGR